MITKNDLKQAYGPVGYCAKSSDGSVTIIQQPHQSGDPHATVGIYFSKKLYAGTNATCHVPTTLDGSIDQNSVVTCDGVINGNFGRNRHDLQYQFQPGCFSYDDHSWEPVKAWEAVDTYEYQQCKNCDEYTRATKK